MTAWRFAWFAVFGFSIVLLIFLFFAIQVLFQAMKKNDVFISRTLAIGFVTVVGLCSISFCVWCLTHLK